MKITQEQGRAISARARKLITVAAAGSGKTHVLVHRYLALLDANADWRIPSLVAITFTRAAAREMRERVREHLQTRLSEARAEGEKKRWSDRLSELPSARIQTIHSLCADILRANAASIRLDTNFRVLDEAETCALLDDAIANELASDETGVGAYRALFIHFRERDIREVLRRETEPLLPIANAETLFAGWLAEWEAAARGSLASFSATNSDTTIDVPAEDRLGERWCSALVELAEMREDVSAWHRYQSVEKIATLPLTNAGKAEHWGGKEKKAAALEKLKKLVRAARNLRDEIRPPPDENDRQAAEDLQRWQALISRVQERFRSAKERHDALDYDDLEVRCSELLSDEAVCARYQSEFRHLLVDEFQDTNQRQWQIVRALTEGKKAASLFLVGDPRQSIYAFRGADVRVFNRIRMRIGDDFEEIALSTSFRTHAPLIRAFNNFFGQLLAPAAGQKLADYEVSMGEPLRAHRQSAPSDDPPLELLCVNQSRLKGVWQQTNRLAARRWEACLLAQRLHELVANHTLIHDKDTDRSRPLEYDDIAILFRSLSDITLYEEVFAAGGLPYFMHAGRGFYERQEIWDVLNLLAALQNPRDELALASALRSSLGNLSDDALYALREERDENGAGRRSLCEQVIRAAAGELPLFPTNELDTIHKFAQMLTDLRALRGRLSVAELLGEVLERSDFRAIVGAGADGERARGNLEKLVDVARARGDIQLSDFQTYIRNMRAREVHEGQSEFEVHGAVSLMTTHASKGLEFPVVVLADLGRSQLREHSWLYQRDSEQGTACRVLDDETGEEVGSYAYRRLRALAEHKSAAEDKRLLYVAATRARDRLLLSGIATERHDGSWSKQVANWEAILGWLDVDGADAIKPDRAVIQHYPWGSVRCYVAQTPPREDTLRSVRDSPPTPVAIQETTLLNSQRFAPALLGEIAPVATTGLRHISASQLVPRPHQRDSWADIERRFADDDDDGAIGGKPTSARSKELGSLVHAALRKEQIPSPGEVLLEMLTDLCWRLGFGNRQNARSLIAAAARLLETYRRSDLYRELCAAEPSAVYREYPFIYRGKSAVIHGRIDLLYRQRDGSWYVLDYKTSAVPGAEVDEAVLQCHAANYTTQLAAYHAAASSAYGDRLHAAVHYLRYGRTVPISVEELKRALAELDELAPAG